MKKTNLVANTAITVCMVVALIIDQRFAAGLKPEITQNNSGIQLNNRENNQSVKAANIKISQNMNKENIASTRYFEELKGQGRQAGMTRNQKLNNAPIPTNTLWVQQRMKAPEPLASTTKYDNRKTFYYTTNGDN